MAAAVKQGWKIDHKKNIPGNFAADVSEGQVAKITANDAFDVCGAGDVPRGVAFRTLDISEDGARGEIMTSHTAVCKAAATIDTITLPLKAAANGEVTPVTGDKDIIVGMPLNTAASGSLVSVDLKLLGSFYGA